MDHWADTFEHASVTDENREAFTSHMAKFPTQADATANHMELAKMVGKPFKFPESMDKLPDDASRGEFTSQANVLLGRTIPKDLDGLKDVNFKEGLADDAEMDDKVVGLIKQWAVDEKISTQAVAKMVALFNGPMTEVFAGYNTEATEKSKADQVVAVKACNDSLAKHPDFGNVEAVDAQTKLLHVALMNNCKLSPEDANEVSEFLRDREGATNPVLRKLLIDRLAPLAAESNNHNNNNTNNQGDKPIDPNEGSPSYVALGFSTQEQGEAWKARQVKAPA